MRNPSPQRRGSRRSSAVAMQLSRDASEVRLTPSPPASSIHHECLDLSVSCRNGGVDGLIKEDKLGLDVVCLQAKRWEGTVGRPVVQGFVGSMDYVRARKGVILTTSSFSREAVDYVDWIEGKKVVLIGGERLAELMIEHGVGVATTQVYELKEVSNDFFDEDEG